MIDELLIFDRELFLWLNHNLANPVFDLFFPFITNVKNWYPVYIVGGLWLLIKGGKKGRIAFLLLLLTIIISDQISSSVIKEAVGRLRPCHVLPDVRLLVGCGGGKSFPSSHATNNFAAAFILSRIYKRQWPVFYTIAFFMAFSRVYIGVHYPLDITGGAILGVIIGAVIIFAYKMIDRHIINKQKLKSID